jgi:hypothetical protein
MNTDLYRWYETGQNKIAIVQASSEGWVPTSTDDAVIRVKYKKEASPITAMDQALEVQPKYHSYIMHGIIAQLTEILGGKQTVNSVRFQEGIAKARKDMSSGRRTTRTMIRYPL